MHKYLIIDFNKFNGQCVNDCKRYIQVKAKETNNSDDKQLSNMEVLYQHIGDLERF